MPHKTTLPQNDTQEDTAVRVSISEASRLFGVNPRTIRRAIASGEVRYIIVRNRYQLHFESLLRWSQRHVTIQHKRDARGIGQWVDQWKIRNPKFSPRTPELTNTTLKKNSP
jgi:excisionase family DNA binding protein